MTETTPFLCLVCREGALMRNLENLTCPACRAEYPLQDGVPILLPPIEQQKTEHSQGSQSVSSAQLQAIYDRVYEHDGLMGTDLDETYDRVTKEMLLAFAEPLAGTRLLDLGTGVGNLWQYVPAGVRSYALDVSPIGVRKAMERHPQLTASVSLAEHVPYPDGFFDVVLAADTIEHISSPQRALNEVHRVLRPGGILSASFPIPDSLRKWGWNQFVHQRPDLKLFARLIWVLIRRTLLFGRPHFQPVDWDLATGEWIEMLRTSGFAVDRQTSWPESPKLPIVTLLRAVRG